MRIPPIEALEEVDSTNAEARRRAERGESGPIWITALRQTAGRGRRGRSWETGEGNLAATYLFSTDKPAAEAAQISFVAALASADLAKAYAPPNLVSLKWPNDTLISGMKTAGILVESGTVEGGGLWVAVGVGVNLAEAPVGIERPATAFARHMDAPPPSPLEALAVLAEALEDWRAIWQAAGFAPIAAAWSALAYGLGQRCVARLADASYEGVAEGLDPDGALRLRSETGVVRRITAGDIYFGS